MKVAGWDISKIRKSVLGKEFETTNCGKCVIVDYKGRHDVFVKFYCPEYVVKCSMYHLKLGNVTNPLYPTLYGVGCIGVGKHNSKNNERVYKIWNAILQRCYSEHYHKSMSENYKGVLVCDEWHNFQNFANWWESNGFSNFVDCRGYPYQLDKDILSFENKIYSPNTCCFIPKEINSLVVGSKKSKGDCPIGVSYHIATGKFMSRLNKGVSSNYLGVFETVDEAFQVYKKAKEVYIKEVANKWKGKIDDRVYEALMNWEIHIDG